MAELMVVRKNPKKRKKVRKLRASKRRTPVKRKKTRASSKRRTRRRSNPTARGIIKGQIMPAAMYAAGAISIDVLWSFIPIPANLKMGPLRHIAKGAGAIGLGMVAGNFINKSTARSMTMGALTVVAYQALKEVVQPMLPNIPLGYYSPGMPTGEYTNGMGAYVTGGSKASPYLSNSLSTPFAGPSAAVMASEQCSENMGSYY